MQYLEPADIHRLNAALGWLGLGNVAEAQAELKSVNPAQGTHPAVLEVRWLLCVHEQTWKDALAVADSQRAFAPEDAAGWLHRAYALRRVTGGGLTEAWNALRPAAEMFPTEPVIPYNLSCYACQLNELEASRVWLKRALKVGGREAIKKMALADEDLKPLWPEIAKL